MAGFYIKGAVATAPLRLSDFYFSDIAVISIDVEAVDLFEGDYLDVAVFAAVLVVYRGSSGIASIDSVVPGT